MSRTERLKKLNADCNKAYASGEILYGQEQIQALMKESNLTDEEAYRISGLNITKAGMKACAEALLS